jgi:hypothetical protein
MSMHDDPAPHRLFAAIVLMGTGLASGCGGISASERQVEGGAGQPTAGVPGAAGASTATGGRAELPQPETGGTPEKVTPGPFACPPQQWSCSRAECGVTGLGWSLPENCDCDPTRPLAPSSCAPGEVFVCKTATSTADGRLLTEEVPMSCACLPPDGAVGDNECARAYGDDLRDTIEADGSVGCSCAYVYLK